MAEIIGPYFLCAECFLASCYAVSWGCLGGCQGIGLWLPKLLNSLELVATVGALCRC